MKKNNNFIEYLYDIAHKEGEGEEELSTFDEQKLRKELEGNKKLMARNSELFSQEPKFHTCMMYNPCQICDKCLNKASHLYVKCQTCQIPICIHTYKQRSQMIRRKNFRIPVTKDAYNKLLELEKRYVK